MVTYHIKTSLHPIWFMILITECLSVNIRNGSYIDCSGYMECNHYILKCNPYQDCHVICTASSSCWGATVICPVKANCTVDCDTNDGDACKTINITAITSTSLTWNWGTGQQSSESATVYCPNNGHSGAIPCIFNNVNTKALRSTIGGIEVYAVEGFNDVQIIGESLNTNSYINCGENYEIRCLIDNTVSPFKCPACENILSPSQYPTESPSNDPTFEPTIQPTNNPSITPTNVPSGTTQYPTNYPTKTPSIYPSKYPTNNPSIGPTGNPVIDGLVGDVTTTDYFKNQPENKGKNASFWKATNIIIIILCSLILILICFIIRKKYRKRKNKSVDDEKQITNVIIELGSKSTKSDMVIHSTNGGTLSVSNEVDTEQCEDMYTVTRTTTRTPEQVEYIKEEQDEDISENELYDSPSTNGFILEGNSPGLTAMNKTHSNVQVTCDINEKYDKDVNRNNVLLSEINTNEGGDNV